MRKYLQMFGAALICAASINANGQQAANDLDEFIADLPDVVARIGEENVTKAEFGQALEMTQARQRMREDVPDDFALTTEDRYKVLQLLIESKAMRILAHKAEIEVTEEQIDEAIRQEMERAGGEEAFNNTLAQSGMTLEQYRDLVKEQLIQKAFADSKVQDVTVTEEELRQHFEKVEQSGRTQVPARAEVRHILILARGEEDEAWAKAEAEIEEARKRIVDEGADFAAVAKEISEDPRSAQNGGLVRIAEGTGQSDFERYAFELEEGKVSPPFRSDVGWHILKVVQRLPGKKMTFDEVKDRFREQLLTFKRTQQFRQRLIQEMQGMDIEVLISPPSEQPAQPDEVNLDEINDLLQQSQ